MHGLFLLGFFILSVLANCSVQATELPVEGGPGGGPFKFRCNKGEYLVGFSIKSGAFVDAIYPLCAPFLSGEKRFGKWGRAIPFGGRGGSQLLRDGFCPSDRFVSGIKFGWTRKNGSPEFIDYVELTCSLIAGSGRPTKVCLQTGDGCWDDHPNPPTYFLAPFLQDPFKQFCPQGEAAIGIHGRSGIYLDALGLICGPRPTVPAAPASLSTTDSRDNVNLPGRDYTTFVPPYADSTPCWAACADDERCRAYTWVKPNFFGQGPTGRCYLKDSVPASVADNCCKSGLKGKKLRLLLLATANNDVDIYDGPGGNYNVIGMMRAGAKAGILEKHPDGWCKLQRVAMGRDGWVAQDHLTGCR
jgi:hypothetical protein